MNLTIFSISFLFLIMSVVRAGEALVVTYDNLPGRVRAQNPELAAARLLIREARARADQSGRRSNPELQFAVEHNREFNEGRVELGLSQRFPVTDRLRRETLLSASRIAIAENEVRVVEQGLVTQARTALIEVLAIRERRDLVKQQAAVSAELAASIAQAADKGEASRLDAGQARVEALRVASELHQLDIEESTAIAPLKPLLGMSPGQTLVVGGKLPPVGQMTGSGPTVKRPDLEVARLEVEAASREEGLEQSRRYEDFEAGIMVAAERVEDEPMGRSTEGLVGFQLKIPLPFWNKNQGAVDEAKARGERKQIEHRALARSIQLEVASTRDEMRGWADLASEISNKLVPEADQQTREVEAAWKNGQGTLQAVLKAREQRLQLASSGIEAIRGYHLAAVRHQAAVGAF